MLRLRGTRRRSARRRRSAWRRTTLHTRQLLRSRSGTRRGATRRVRTDALSQKALARRIAIVGGVVGVVLCGIVVRLYFLQIVHGADYRAKAAAQYEQKLALMPARGTVYAQTRDDVYPLAINKTFGTVYLVPKNIAPERFDAVVALLRDALGDIDEARVRAKLAKRDDPYEVVARRVEDDAVAKIRDAVEPGVYVRNEVLRYYPAGDIAAQTIGFVGSDGKRWRGMYGLEAAFEAQLAGTRGFVNQRRDAFGRWITLTDRVKRDAQDGVDIVTTLNYDVQFAVEEIVRDAVKQYGARSGAAIVMQPDGAVLAMAAFPSFDPNAYGTVEDIARFRNPIVADPYEAGSVFKPLTMAIGIDAGVITPESTYTDTGAVSIGGYTIKNAQDKVYGVRTMTEVLEHSINTGVIHVERLVGHERFAAYVARFGFGEKTGIALPGEAAGTIRNLRPPIKPIQFYTASFGQGITMTMVQLAQAFAVIANDGMLVRPRIVAVLQRDGAVIERFAPEERRRVLRADTARAVRAMMTAVVENKYTRRVKINGYRIAGKTGTAQVAKRGARGYRDAETIHSFVGIVPSDAPQFVVVVRLDAPTTSPWSFYTAAPTFRRIAAFLLSYYNVEPTEEVAQDPAR